MELEPESVDRALFHLEAWLADPEGSEHRAALGILLESDPMELWDAFRDVLPFGTGGRRGRVGFGPNRINPLTVARTAAGHVQWLRQRRPSATSVVLAWDTRRFEDRDQRLGAAAGPLRA